MKVAIYYKRLPKMTGTLGRLYAAKPQFQAYLSELIDTGASLGHEIVVCCGQDSYAGGKIFQSYWLPDTSKPEEGWLREVHQSIEVDVVYDKGHIDIVAGVPIINIPELARFGRNKKQQYEIFNAYMPKSIYVRTREDAIRVREQFRVDERVVVKPINLNGGNGIIIRSLEDISDSELLGSGPGMLVQEFIDSSMGIPSIVDGIHDLRFYMMNNSVTLCSVRTPKIGQLIANTSQGGTIRFFDEKLALNHQIEAILQAVDNYMNRFGSRYYSIDMIYSSGKYYLLEINDRPGIPARYQSRLVGDFHKRLIETIIDAAHDPINQSKKELK